MKLTDNNPVYKISHTVDIDNLLGIDNLDGYVNNFLDVFPLDVAVNDTGDFVIVV